MEQTKCGHQRKSGKCGYHQHDKDGTWMNECTRDEWKHTKRCRRHQSSRGN